MTQVGTHIYPNTPEGKKEAKVMEDRLKKPKAKKPEKPEKGDKE